MGIKNKEKSSLELMSFEDIAYELIKEDNKPIPTQQLFQEICHLLEYSDEEYEANVSDFFTSLTIDKRFVLINNINWDLRENHVVKMVVDQDDVDEMDEEEFEKFNEEGELLDETAIEEDDMVVDLDEEAEAFDDLNDMDIIEEDTNLDE